MESTPTTRRLPKNTMNWRLGHNRRGRFLLQFDTWRRKFRTLRHALQNCGMRRCVYYRWKKGQVVPKESALRRYCRNTGIDLQYVLTGIPGKVGNNQLTLSYYQKQHKEATTAQDRDRVYWRLVTETALVLREEFPFSAEIATDQEPVAILTYWVVDKLYRFEILIKPTSDGYVGFEVIWWVGSLPTLTMEGECDEGCLLLARRHMRDMGRKYRKNWEVEDVRTPFRKKETAFMARHNARYR